MAITGTSGLAMKPVHYRTGTGLVLPRKPVPRILTHRSLSQDVGPFLLVCDLGKVTAWPQVLYVPGRYLLLRCCINKRCCVSVL